MRKAIRAMATIVLAAGAADAQPRDVTVRLADCRVLERHVPSPDVAFRPGVDIHGRAVAPADLGGGAGVAIPPVVRFGLAVDPFVAQGRRSGAPPGFGETALDLGTVEVDTATGRATLDGRPLGPAEREALLEVCRSAPR